ncbi:cell adhesion molecule Dscam2 [Sabethes cyaneus]|uniref:cell adhesion molecule Dscam2 n=1 Tax=Sabethes cyaneus TaxID=53552 RepID=UPI00237E7FC6|nr:cell adhesion molecule Dscam2 [Sabethes cyaneus]
MIDRETIFNNLNLKPLPTNIMFSNNTGYSELICSTYGSSQIDISWILKDGSIAGNIIGLREILPNGTLYFFPFAAHLYRTDVHDTTYRCRATIDHYTILSADIKVRAIVRQTYDIKVTTNDVGLGSTAFLQCNISPHVREFVYVTAWYRDKEMLPADRSDFGMRYLVTSPSGDLCLRIVNIGDRQKQFSCATTDVLTGETKISDPVYLTITDFISDSSPRTTQKPILEISTDQGSKIQLPCNVQGNPQPVFTWFRVSNSGSLYTVPSSQRIIPSQSLLFIRKTVDGDAGRWICKAANQFGEQRLQIHLTINSELLVHIHPQMQVINTGDSAKFNCTVMGSESSQIEWFHNGRLLTDDNRMGKKFHRFPMTSTEMLQIDNINKEDCGVYQCIVSNIRTSRQTSAELKLGETPPEIMYNFGEQNIHPGTFVSLKCTASGSPNPKFIWLLDYQPIVPSTHRYTVDQFIDDSGRASTHLNITHVNADDGGLYACVASNTMGTALEKARLNVYGPPYVRAISAIKAVAGESKEIYCPFSGYPISQIQWLHNGYNLSANLRYAISGISHGETLRIHRVNGIQDKGVYTCIVTSPNGDEARRDIQLIINSPPVIESFSFPKNIKVGGRAQLTCSVSSGDMPVYFSWKKDGATIPLKLQVSERKEEFFSLLILKNITAKHRGRYTCFALNAAAEVNHTAELLVQVPPTWKQEPSDLSVIMGSTISVTCEAEGFPQPKVTWYRGQHKMSKNFHSIPLKNETLNVNYATSSDAGYYMCEAYNGVGDTLSKIIKIDVNVAAHFDSSIKNISARRNDAVILECVALGDDPIKITWTHKKSRIDFNNYRYNLVEIKVDNGIRSQLSINHAERFDSGKYVCSAENLYGTSEQITYLAVQEKPDAPSDLEVLEVNSRKIKLSWKRPYDGMSPVLSYLLQYQPLRIFTDYIGENVDLTWENSLVVNLTLSKLKEENSTLDSATRDEAFVEGLHPATQYLVRMLAINEIACSSFTDQLVVKTQEEAPTEAPTNLKVKPGGPGELIVTWQIPNKDTWNGELLGYTLNCIEEKQNINFISNNNSQNLTFTANGWATTKMLISNLKKFTRYSVKIRSFNAIAAGPWSPITHSTTLEGVPDTPPQNVTCNSLSSQSIKVQWQEPPPQYHNGILQGYKVLYRSLSTANDLFTPCEVKRTSNLETYLHALLKATNYSIQVLSFTLSGDGISSTPIFCATEEDVPEAPTGVKALILTADSILVSWLKPKHANGIISHYTIFSKNHGKIGHAKSYLVRLDEQHPLLFEVRGLSENRKYDFWVTASTSKGEGDATIVVTQETNTRAPARIASFSQTLKAPVGTSISLECIAVGNPTPRTRWITNDQPVTFSPYYSISQRYLKIYKIEPNLSGNYTCTAKNLFGEDSISYILIVLQTPNITLISIQYASYDSVRIIWETSFDGGAPIQGFNLFYRPASGIWSSVSIPSEQFAYTLNGLKCGSQYILKMNAHNKAGVGVSTDDLTIWTKGKAPHIPEDRELIVTNATCLSLNLHTWHDGGCPITHFSIEYRRLHTPFWTTVSSDISGIGQNSDSISFCDFQPAVWYELKIASSNDAGETVAQFNFATTTLMGDKIPPPEYTQIEINNGDHSEEVPKDIQWMISIVIIATLITVVLFFVLLVKYRKMCLTNNSGNNIEEISNNCIQKEEATYMRTDQIYSASPVKMLDKEDNSEMYEISPYATFNDTNEQESDKAVFRNRTHPAVDYSLQFRTFGHPENELHTTAYPLLECAGFGNAKNRAGRHKQMFNTGGQNYNRS